MELIYSPYTAFCVSPPFSLQVHGLAWLILQCFSRSLAHVEEKAHHILMLLITIIMFYFPQIPKQPFVHDQVGGALNANKYSAAS